LRKKSIAWLHSCESKDSIAPGTNLAQNVFSRKLNKETFGKQENDSMNSLSTFAALGALLVAAHSPSYGQTAVRALRGAELGSRQNRELLAQRNVAVKVAHPHPDTVVFVGDWVIPHFIDGGSWQTAVTVVNLENHQTSFDVLFFTDSGADFIVPIEGQGLLRGVHITLGIAGSYTFQTTGTDPNLASGWAYLSQSTNDSVGAYAIFRSAPFGEQPQEAVVPAVNKFETHFVLPFDNTGQFVTGVALANPTLSAVEIPANIRDEQGQIIDTQLFSLGSFGHAAFVLPGTWPSTVGIRGTVEFLTSGFGVGALGIRANGRAYTSLSVMENLNWVVTH
jgi:hypothetical protein